ncbi:MAG: hypothetical protein IJX35_02955, partial [Candidatus Methanomethylophilaceae archaeon]|nr:hypothetical protein [Candidatus Methanomethylophilaceae archaeon]
MRSQTLAVSLVLLLIAVATLPGISYSLSSSVTSYNNQITFINDGVSMGFYGHYENDQYSDMYTGTPFDQAKLSLEEVKDSGGTVTGYRTFTDYRSMSDMKNVFFQLKGANSFNITISFAYEGGYTGSEILDKARLIMKPLSGGDSRTVEFKDTNIDGGTLTQSGLDASTGYLLDIEVGCTTQKTVSIGESKTYIPLVITFTASYDQSEAPLSETFGGSHVGFAIVKQKYNGVTIDDTHEFREPASNDPNNPPAGAVVVSNTEKSDDSFINKGDGNTASMSINTDGTQRFKFYVYAEGKGTGL